MKPDPDWFDDLEDLDPLFSSPKKLTDDEIKRILELFVSEKVTEAEAEAAFERMNRSRKRVCPFVLELCRSTDPPRHQMGAILVRELNLVELRQSLRELIQDPELEDSHKMSLLPALASVGGIKPDENPLIYLRDPETAMRQTRDALIAELNDPFRLSQILEDDVASGNLQMADPAIIAQMAASRDRGLMRLMMCLLHARQDATVLTAINALQAIGDAAALAALEERAEWDASAKVRRAARKAATELAASLAKAAPTIFELPVAPPPVERCLITTIDGAGGQMAMIIRRATNGQRQALYVMFNDQTGISDCIGGLDEAVARLEDMLLDDPYDLGFDVVDVRLSHVRAELERAYQTTLKARRRLPPAYPAWRDWLCGDDDRPLEFYSLPSLTDAEIVNLLPRCAQLLDLSEFVSWEVKHRDLDSYERRYSKLRGRPRADDAIEAVISDAIAQLCDPAWCALVKDRLERQAWLLAQLYEEKDIPMLALAAAHGLDPASGVRPANHPLVREMMRRTLAGPLLPF
jgi:hypothetical protein